MKRRGTRSTSASPCGGQAPASATISTVRRAKRSRGCEPVRQVISSGGMPAATSARERARQAAKSVSCRNKTSGILGEQIELPRFRGKPGAQIESVEPGGRPALVGGDDERLDGLDRHPEPSQVFETDGSMATDGQQPIYRALAEPGDPEQLRAIGLVDIDRKAVAVTKRPSQLWIDLQVQHLA